MSTDTQFTNEYSNSAQIPKYPHAHVDTYYEQLNKSKHRKRWVIPVEPVSRCI